jgi:hypothetical protein
MSVKTLDPGVIRQEMLKSENKDVTTFWLPTNKDTGLGTETPPIT